MVRVDKDYRKYNFHFLDGDKLTVEITVICNCVKPMSLLNFTLLELKYWHYLI